MHKHNNKAVHSAYRHFLSTAIIGVLFAIVSSVILLPHQVISQTGTTPLTGWLWSDNTGWISLNCSTGGPTVGKPSTNICGTGTGEVNYGVNIDGSGNLSGYGWSDNVGWVQFGGLSSFPSGSGTTAANATLVNGALSGWARACAGTAAGDCSSMTSRTDGWDGWISLNGLTTGGVVYQVSGTNGAFNPCTNGSSCAWGSDVNGWVDASYAKYQCTSQPNYCKDTTTLCTFSTQSCSFSCSTCSYQCQSGSCIAPPQGKGGISANPSLIATGTTSHISWWAQNVTNSCTVNGTNGDGSGWSGTYDVTNASTTGSHASSKIFAKVTYTLSCTGIDRSAYSWQTTVDISPAFQEK